MLTSEFVFHPLHLSVELLWFYCFGSTTFWPAVPNNSTLRFTVQLILRNVGCLIVFSKTKTQRKRKEKEEAKRFWFLTKNSEQFLCPCSFWVINCPHVDSNGFPTACIFFKAAFSFVFPLLVVVLTAFFVGWIRVLLLCMYWLTCKGRKSKNMKLT